MLTRKFTIKKHINTIAFLLLFLEKNRNLAALTPYN